MARSLGHGTSLCDGQVQDDGDGIHGGLAGLVQLGWLLRGWLHAGLWEGKAATRGLRLPARGVGRCADGGAVVGAGDGEHARDEDGAAFGLLGRGLAGVGAGRVGGRVRGREGLGQAALLAEAFEASIGARQVGLWLGLERHNVHLVRIAAVRHARAPEHALEARVDQVGRLSRPRLGLGLGLRLRVHVGVLVDVGHG